MAECPRHGIEVEPSQGCSAVYLAASERIWPFPEASAVMDARPVGRAVEPDDSTAEAQELGLHGRVVGHEDRGTVKDFRSGRDDLDRDAGLAQEPPVSLNHWSTWVPVSEHPPSCVMPSEDSVLKMWSEMTESASSFQNSRVKCIPVERDGDCTILYLLPKPGVPRVQTWRPDDSGRLVRIPSEPSTGHFRVRAYEAKARVVPTPAAVEPVSTPTIAWPPVRLTGPVFYKDVRDFGGTLDIGVPRNEVDHWCTLCEWPLPIFMEEFTGLARLGKSFPDREQVVEVVGLTSD